jgi:hypothetical protein
MENSRKSWNKPTHKQSTIIFCNGAKNTHIVFLGILVAYTYNPSYWRGKVSLSKVSVRPCLKYKQKAERTDGVAKSTT